MDLNNSFYASVASFIILSLGCIPSYAAEPMKMQGAPSQALIQKGCLSPEMMATTARSVGTAIGQAEACGIGSKILEAKRIEIKARIASCFSATTITSDEYDFRFEEGRVKGVELIGGNKRAAICTTLINGLKATTAPQ